MRDYRTSVTMVSMVGAAILFVLFVYLTARFVTGGRGPNGARFGAIVAIYLVVWLLIAVGNTTTAVDIARFGADGVSTAVAGVVHFLNALFGTH